MEILGAIAEGDDTDNELYLQYQPIMDLKTGSIFGFEALSRVRSAKLGMIPPSNSFPLPRKQS